MTLGLIGESLRTGEPGNSFIPGISSSLPPQSPMQIRYDLGHYVDSRQLFVEDNLFQLIEKKLDQIRGLIENGKLNEARQLLSLIPIGISNKLDNWHRILAKPKVKAKKLATGQDMRLNLTWVQNESAKYRGRWVALNRGKLLGSHENRTELHQIIKQSGRLKGAMFFKVAE